MAICLLHLWGLFNSQTASLAHRNSASIFGKSTQAQEMEDAIGTCNSGKIMQNKGIERIVRWEILHPTKYQLLVLGLDREDCVGEVPIGCKLQDAIFP